MNRDIIHSEFPFTADEVAAAWIVYGSSVDDAVRDGVAMKEGIREDFNQPLEPDVDLGDGWTLASGRGGVAFFGGFDATLHLLADVHADGNILTSTAREAWTEQWPHDFSANEVDELVERLSNLGTSWAGKRAELHQLLQHRGKPRLDIM